MKSFEDYRVAAVAMQRALGELPDGLTGVVGEAVFHPDDGRHPYAYATLSIEGPLAEWREILSRLGGLAVEVDGYLTYQCYAALGIGHLSVSGPPDALVRAMTEDEASRILAWKRA